MKKTILFKLLTISFSSMSCSATIDNLAINAQIINQQPIYQNNDLWQRMRDGFELNHNETPEVKYWEKKYGNPKYFNIIMRNAYPYLYFVIGEMERRGIPTELALVPIVESTYNPNAVSPTGISTGMWQFLTGSGKRFGMNINSQVDERQDIIKSTRGAVNYFLYLNNLFGSWELAIAAYNWGEGNINKAVVKAGSNNFYDLDVRDVTKQYVPKVIALANIIQNPERFGIKLIDIPNQPYFSIAKPNQNTTIAEFIDKTNISAELNKKLNPHIKSKTYLVNNENLLTPVDSNPYISLTKFSDITTNIQKNNQAEFNYDDDPLNTLLSANNDKSNNEDSNQVNNLLSEDSARLSQPIAQDITIDSTGSFISYKVTQGDTLYSISKKFSISIEQIKTDNNLYTNNLNNEQILKIRNSQT